MYYFKKKKNEKKTCIRAVLLLSLTCYIKEYLTFFFFLSCLLSHMSDNYLIKNDPASTLGKRAYDVLNESSSVSSVVTVGSSSNSLETDSSGPNTPKCWLPPVSSLLSSCYDEHANFTFYAPQVPQQHLKKKNKLNTPRQVFMPMIPYYFHHKNFGIESCMLQLEGQKKFNNYYYI